MIKMQLFVVLLLVGSIQAQPNSCLCSCCSGFSCNPTSLPDIYVQNCTLESCLGQCRARYSQCQGNYPTGHLSAQCVSTVAPQFNCQCNCCNTGSPLCSPTYVGTTSAYLCQPASCSIACQQQYPSQCRADQNGLTQGTCIGSITTTTTTTTIGPWLGNTCLCTCCSSGSICSPTTVGVTSASYCSSTDCMQACRNRYPTSCLSSSNINQLNGACINDFGARTFCNCQCCENNGCINYKINTNGSCTTCNAVCRQYTPCRNTAPVTVQTCSTNHAKATLPTMIYLWFITLSTLFFYI